jgi:predicted ArsR family transcriptional regulator
MHKPTQLRILEYLRKHQTASVRELSSVLTMTGANIRHHLAVLESNDLIEIISKRGEGRGRPESVYSLSRRVLGDGLGELAGAIFNVWLDTIPESALETSLRFVARRLGGNNLSNQDILLTHRLPRLVDRLNELHYQSHWEAGLHGPTIILGHCPYAAIINRNPELCRMDAFLLEQWIGLSVEQTTRLHKGVNGASYCTFRTIGSL